MTDSEHPLDRAARSLANANKRLFSQTAAGNYYWEMGFPICETTESGRQADFDIDDESRSKALLGPGCDWTDALSSNAERGAYLVNDKTLRLFEHFELGERHSTTVTVTAENGESIKYNYLVVKNEIHPMAVDFSSSDFYFTDIIGLPLAGVRIDSFEHWQETFDNAQAGNIEGYDEFTDIRHKRLVFREDSVPRFDIFSFHRIATEVYLSNQLRDAIEGHGIAGFDLQPSRRLFGPAEAD